MVKIETPDVTTAHFDLSRRIVADFCRASDAELSLNDINFLTRVIASGVAAALEAELAALRQVVADVETCVCSQRIMAFSATTDERERCLMLLGHKQFHAPTWQAALHAAAEHVRREAYGPSNT